MKTFEEFNWFKKKEYSSEKTLKEIEDLLIKSRKNFENFMDGGQKSWSFAKFSSSMSMAFNLLELMDKHNEEKTKYYIDKFGVLMSDFDVKSFVNKNLDRDDIIKFINLIQKYNIKKLSNGWGPDFVIGSSRHRRYSD